MRGRRGTETLEGRGARAAGARTRTDRHGCARKHADRHRCARRQARARPEAEARARVGGGGKPGRGGGRRGKPRARVEGRREARALGSHLLRRPRSLLRARRSSRERKARQLGKQTVRSQRCGEGAGRRRGPKERQNQN